MSMHAKGPFDVTMTPQKDEGADANLGRFTLEKTFHGELEARGKGQMLTVGTDVQGSAVYVAVEKVAGTLGGRQGGFSLYHQGVMTRGTPSLTVTIVPDSGTGALQGIAGTLGIDILDGRHFYDLAYTLPTG
jgi:hypothetical protein